MNNGFPGPFRRKSRDNRVIGRSAQKVGWRVGMIPAGVHGLDVYGADRPPNHFGLVQAAVERISPGAVVVRNGQHDGGAFRVAPPPRRPVVKKQCGIGPMAHPRRPGHRGLAAGQLFRRPGSSPGRRSWLLARSIAP